MASHGGSSFSLFCFRQFFRGSYYYSHQCDRSPAGESVSFCVCWGAGANSWPHRDELVLLFTITYCFLSFALFVFQHGLLLTLVILLFVHMLHADLLCTGLDDVLSQLEQVKHMQSRVLPRLGDTSDTSGDESNAGEPRRRLRSKKSYKMKRAWGTSDVGRLFVTGPTDVATKPSHFYCRICHHEILRHFQGSKHFPRDQRLRLETPGWEVLDYEGNVMSPEEVERQREKIMRAPLVVRDREYPFLEDVIVDETGEVDPNLGVMAKVSSLIEVLRLGGSYELVYHLWAQFTLSAIRVNVDVTWSRNEVLVGSFTFAPCILCGLCASNLFTVSVHHPEWDVSADSVSLHQLGQITRELRCWIWGGRW